MPRAPRRKRSFGRRVATRPTAPGWQAIFFGILAFGAALLFGTTQIYQLAYALAGLLLAALVLGLFFSRGLDYERRVPEGERPSAGRPFYVELVVSNASRRRSPKVEILDRLPEKRRFHTPPVEEGGTRKIRETVLFAKRGLYELGPAEVRTTDPFGLLRFVRRFAARTQIVVYPEVFDLADFPLRGRKGEAGSEGSFAHRGDDFSGLREYRRGDDRRHIHWKSVARTGQLVVREFAQEAPRRHAVVLDLQRPGIGSAEAGEDVEDAVSAAGSVLQHLVREGLPFGLLCTDKGRSSTPFGTGEESYRRAMDLLAVARADGEVKPGDFLDGKLHENFVEAASEKLGECVFLISRSLDDDLAQSVEKLRALGLQVVVLAIASHTYRTGGAPKGGREAAISENVRRLERAGAEVRVVRRPDGVATFAGAQGASGVRGVV